MPKRRKGRTQALPPKSPRVVRDPNKADSMAADRGAQATTANGPRHRAASTHPPQAPRTPQRQVPSIPSPLPAAVPPRRPSPPPRSPRVLPQSAAPGSPARATASAPLHSAVEASPRAPPTTPLSGLTTALGPRQQTSSAPIDVPRSSSGRSLVTYASVVKNRCANLSPRLAKFLEHEFNANSLYLKTPIVPIKAPQGINLMITFDNVLKYDKELACAICNCQKRFHEWVNPTASEFLTHKGILKNVGGKIEVTFSGMPDSIKPLAEFLQEHRSLIRVEFIFGGSFELCIARNVGMMLVHGFLVEVFKTHSKDLTWNGGFDIMDMVVVNSKECRITKKSMEGGSHGRAKDLHKIGEIFMPMFSSKRGTALYFDVLQKDLSKASENEVKEEWFREYLLAHPALKGSMARYNFECGLRHAAVTIGVGSRLIQSVLDGCSCSDWKAIIPTEVTEKMLVTDFSLHKVFWFKCEHTEGVEDPFMNTLGGLLAYKRNFLQHGHEYLKSNVQKHTDLEQFAAKTFSQALPDILRELLKHCKMHTNEQFMEHWKPYRAAKSWEQ